MNTTQVMGCCTHGRDFIGVANMGIKKEGMFFFFPPAWGLKLESYSLKGFFFPQLCEVGELAIIHKRTEPNLATGQREK
jgi:hypothetical protein